MSVKEKTNIEETAQNMYSFELCEPHVLKSLASQWRREYIELSGFGRDISIVYDEESFECCNIKISKMGFSELMTHICDHMLDCGGNEISVFASCTLGEIHLIITSRTARKGIISSVNNPTDYAKASEPLEYAEKRILCAYKTAQRYKAELEYTRDEEGCEYIELVFDRVDIGMLGFKAGVDNAEIIIGIKRARIQAERD